MNRLKFFCSKTSDGMNISEEKSHNPSYFFQRQKGPLILSVQSRRPLDLLNMNTTL